MPGVGATMAASFLAWGAAVVAAGTHEVWICADALPDARAVEIAVWHPLGDAPRAVFEELVADFNAAHSSIRVTATQMPNYSLLIDRLVDVPVADRPDVLIGMSNSTLNLADSGITLKPGTCPGSDQAVRDLLPVVDATFRVDDQLVAWPYNISTPVLIYNEATLEAAGLDPARPPRTLEELREFADRVVASGAAPHGLVVYDQVGAWVVRQFAAQRGDVIGEPANGRAGEVVERLTFANERVADDFQWLRDGVRSGAFLWIGANPSGVDDLLRLATGNAEAAYTLHTSASIGDLIALLEAGSFPGSRLGVSPLPSSPGAGPGGLVGGGALWMIDSGDPARVFASQLLVEHLMSPPSLARLAARTGYAPPRLAAVDEPDLAAAWSEHPALRVGFDQLAGMPGDAAAAGLLAVASEQIDVTLTWATEELLFSNRPVLDLLEELQARAEAVLRSAAPG